MSTTLASPTLAPLPPDHDPFFYGWRYVRRDLEDGNFVIDQVPLMPEDVLHPEEGDQVTHSRDHQRRVRYLCNVLTAHVAHIPGAVVLDDVRVKWDVPDLKAHGPDVMVIFDVRVSQNWSTFDVAAEGTRPALIVEVTSPETRGFDLVAKLDEYDIAGVPFYVIIDVVERRGQTFARLLGYQRVAEQYQVLPPDGVGRLHLAPVGLWLGVEQAEVYLYDERGVRLGDYSEIVAALDAEQQAREAVEVRAKHAEVRAQAEAKAREAAEARVRELEAELHRLRDGA
jgi:Uma2 family endonuclease